MFRYYSLLLLGMFLSNLILADIGGDNKKPTKAKTYKGYVVTLKGDTLNGKIEMLSPSLNEVKVKLVLDDGETMLFRAKEITSYAFLVPNFDTKENRFKDRWICYVRKKVERPPVPFGPTDVLMQQEIHGSVSLYNYFIETRSQVIDFEHLTLVEKDGEMFKVTKNNYKNVLKSIMTDHPMLVKKIGKKGYRFKSLKSLITIYNTKKKSEVGASDFSAL